MEDIRFIQGVAYIILTVVLTLILYGYIIHLYRSEKKGERDYEKYAKMALDDELDSPPVEKREIEEKEKKLKKEQ
jgi:cytochrome c oxidase cbb3-type subunit 4